MNITREHSDDLNTVIKVNVQKEEISTDVENVLKDYRRKANVPGFRPGKVPMGMIKKMYANSIMVDELNKKVSEGLNNYFVDEKLNILGDPLPSEKQEMLDVDNQNEFNFLFDVALSPEFELKLSKRDKLNYYTIEVSDDMIDEYAESFKNRYGELVEADKADDESIFKGHLIQLDAEGNTMENGIVNDDATISVKVMKDDNIKKEFVKAKKGQIIVFDLKKALPNDTELSALLKIDKENVGLVNGNFQFTISVIKSFKSAELNEELFVKAYGEEVKTEKDFRNRTSSEISNGLSADSRYKFMIDAKTKLSKKLNLKLPEEFLKRWIVATNKELTSEQLEQEFPKFIEDLQWTLIKGKLAKENEISVEPDELKAEAKKSIEVQFKQYGMDSVPEQYLTQYSDEMLNKEEERKKIYERVIDDKVIDFIFDAIKIEEKTVTSDEFRKLFE